MHRVTADRDRGLGNGRRRPSRRPRSGGGGDGGPPPRRGSSPRRKPWAPEGDLPKWIAEELARLTPKKNLPRATELLQASARAFSSGKHGKALQAAEEAKELSPRDPTIRELIGLSAYRMSRWEQALRELRTFRRLTGEATHLPVEMDVLRALVDLKSELHRRTASSVVPPILPAHPGEVGCCSSGGQRRGGAW